MPLRRVSLWLPVLFLAGCAQRSPPPPAPPPPPPLLVPPEPVPAPSLPGDWSLAPLTDGNWNWISNPPARAVYSRAGRPHLVIACEAAGSILLSREAAAPSSMFLSTSFGQRRIAASIEEGRLTARLAPSDPLLDDIVFSRGRFAIESEGSERLIVPSWPEPARVIEQCRGP